MEVNPDIAVVSVEDSLCYFYYAAICYISTKDYCMALHYLNIVISTPANAISKIVEESVKKAKILSLIETSKPYEAPR